ncbi:MAG: T9SS type A sorting domain-containing protein [Bacteroidota bacterium]|jgi:hypothetical protein
MRNLYLLVFLIQSSLAFAQANFAGNVYDNESKKAMKNVQLMVVEEMDTTYITPDEKGNFSFKTKPGRVKIFTIADGFISEMNSVNAGDGSNNKVNIALVKEEVVKNYEKIAIGAPVIAESLTEADDSRSRRIRSVEGTYRDEVSEKYTMRSLDANESVKLRSGVLTAGEVNDFAKWDLWNDLTANEFKVYSGFWNTTLLQRFCIQLKLPSGMPLIDAEVNLEGVSGAVLWTSRTDNTGKAELWIRDSIHLNYRNLSVVVKVGDFEKKFENIHSFSEGVNSFEVAVPCSVADQLDIAFVVDATGSMGDEINYLKLDLDNVISKISTENEHINVRMGSVFYRDKGDEYITREAPFSNKTELVKSFINANEAGGGGDFPEAADEALLEAINKLNWSTSARARIIFWLLDAPPHRAEENLNMLNEATKRAAELGIRIVPIGCSGIDKPTEFLCRSIALATNGTYTFLTSHSGVGGDHIEPSTDGYKVESFREILVRIARSMSITPDCDEFITPEQLDQLDTNLRINNPYGREDTLFVNREIDTTETIADLEIVLYPNPTNGIFHIKSPKEITEVFIVDVNGKLLEQVKLEVEGLTRCDVSLYSNGVYFVQYYNGQRWTSKRLVLHH